MATEKQGMPSLLRTHTAFRWIWIALLVSQAGTKVYLIALAWYFVHFLRDPHGLVIMLLSGSLPLLILGPLAGPILDRHSRRRILLLANLVSCLLTVGIAGIIALSLGSVYIYAAVFLLSLCEVFINPATRALVPAMVGKERIQEATSHLSVVFNLANLLGAAGGGALVGLVGVVGAVLLNAMSFLFSAGAILGIRVVENPQDAPDRFLQSLLAGLAYVRDHRLVLRMLVLSGLLNLFFVAIIVYLPVLISGVLKLDARHFGWAEACAPVGSLVAAGLVVRLPTEAHLAWFRGGVLVLGVAFCLVFLGRSYAAVLAAMALMGMTLTTINIHAMSFFTKSVDAAFLGRFFNLMETISFGTFPLAYLLAGFLMHHIELYTLFLVHGLALLLLGGLAFPLLRDTPLPE